MGARRLRSGGAIVATWLLVAGTALTSSPSPLVASTVSLPSGRGPAGADPEAAVMAAREPVMSQPADWLVWQRAGREGTIPRGAYARAVREAAALEAETERVAPQFAAPEWQHMGPVNFGGRVVDLAVDPTQQNTVYAATASGGVWKSTDAATTFAPSWPENLTPSMGALAIASDGTLYAGTGEPNPGGGSIVYGGTGLYKSSDGGESWKSIGLRNAGAFGRIVVDPSDPNRVFAAASGDLFTPGGERGLYLSDNAGKSWRRVLAGANRTTGAVDVAIDPSNPDNILVGMWDHIRLPTHRVYAGPGSGVYRSTNGGKTWQRAKGPEAATPQETGRIGVAFAPSDPSIAYAVVANKLNGNAVGLFRSEDGGGTWSQTATPPEDLSQSSYGWWFGRIWVDPRIADRLFVAGLEVVESVDGGNTFFPHSNSTGGVATGAFQAGPFVHADQHAMAWDPNIPTRVYLGNDGGVYRSELNGTAGSWVAAIRQGFTQHYTVDVSEQQPSRVVSGLQDNMCQRNYLVGDTGRPDTWSKYGLCGDGLQTLINPQDDRIVYGCAQYGSNCSRTLDGGFAFEFLGDFISQRYGWLVPLQFDPSDPNVMYGGGNMLNRSTDGGASWSVISPDLTTNPKQLDPNPGYRIYGTITTVAAAASDPNVIYVGTDDGLLWRTTDLGKKWTRLVDRDGDDDVPKLWVTRVAIDPDDADTAYVTFSGFRNGSDEPQVSKTTDGGKTWTDISGNLPSAPVTEIIIARNQVMVGTDVGVFVGDGRGRWFSLGSGLPTVPVLDLRFHEETNTVTAATFGFGIQRLTLAQ